MPPISGTANSAGGNPGIDDYAETMTSDHLANRTGGPGYAGSPGNGGGGGGGGFGSAEYTNVEAGVITGVSPLVSWTKWPGGGNGGKGGSGYVQVTGILNNTSGTNAVEFTIPSTNTPFAVNAIPVAVNTVTIEVWGASGGGGGVKTGLFADRIAGGGGAGGYIKVEDVLKTQLGTGNMLIKVGSAGSAGNSSGDSSEVTNGGNGSDSWIKKSDGTVIVSASGGSGGPKDITSSTDSIYPNGGLGGGFSTPSVAGTVTSSQGLSGLGGSNGGGGGTNSIGGNINNGGSGASTNTWAGLSNQSTGGQNGKVRISW